VGPSYLFERNIKCLGKGFLYQTLAQSDPKIAGQNFDDVLAFACGQGRKPLLQELCFGDRTTREVKILEQVGRFQKAEWLWRCSAVENFECSPAGIAISRRAAMKFGTANFGRVLQRAEDRGPSNL